jgi:hypothetical protein
MTVKLSSVIQNPKSKIQNRSEAGQASLIGLLVAVVIIGVLAWVLYFRHNAGDTDREKLSHGAIVDSTKKTVLGASMDQAKGVECQNNLSQIRQALNMDKMSGDEGGMPQTLAGLKGIPASMKVCPASGSPYVYNPQTGEVHCTTPGHERL